MMKDKTTHFVPRDSDAWNKDMSALNDHFEELTDNCYDNLSDPTMDFDAFEKFKFDFGWVVNVIQDGLLKKLTDEQIVGQVILDWTEGDVITPSMSLELAIAACLGMLHRLREVEVCLRHGDPPKLVPPERPRLN